MMLTPLEKVIVVFFSAAALGVALIAAADLRRQEASASCIGSAPQPGLCLCEGTRQ